MREFSYFFWNYSVQIEEIHQCIPHFSWIYNHRTTEHSPSSISDGRVITAFFWDVRRGMSAVNKLSDV